MVGVLLLIIGLLLPYYKTPQRISATGPKVQSLPYTVSTYIIPPIDAGAPISLHFQSDKSGATTILLAPFNANEQTIEIPPVLHVVFAPTQQGIVFYSPAPKTAPYLLMVTSYKNSTFQFIFDSVWSPFYPYRDATVFGVLSLMIGIASLLYSEHAERKERMFRKALTGLADRGAK